MPQSSTNQSEENFFNDLSQDVPINQDMSPPPGDRRDSNEDNSGDREIPKQKRIACVLCRKRKLKCDGSRPACGTCKRLNHDCAYDEVRKKSGPKRGYVKLLEGRLRQVEELLKTQDTSSDRAGQDATRPQSYSSTTFPQSTQSPTQDDTSMATSSDPIAAFMPLGAGHDPYAGINASSIVDPPAGDTSFPWEMIGLGLEEPLPPQATIDELHRIYFEKVHATIPMIHRPRYLAAMNLGPAMRPPICLRYAMWTLAALASDRYESMVDHFYHRARKYLQSDEMKGMGESMINVAHCQTWILVAMYEFKMMYFPRAWLSVGRAARLVQMMGLQRQDGAGLDVKQCLPPPKDWTEREERRRTFWMAFCVDRYASVGTGWPMVIDERDIMTNLPASDEAYEKSKPGLTLSLEQALKPGGAASISAFAGVILMSALFGRNLIHLHRPGPNDRDDDLDGEFWVRHRNMEGILSHISLALPDHLRLPSGLGDSNTIFLNMNIHTSVICLHQAAIFKADKHQLPANIGSESRVRCVTAAAEIARIMRMLSHLDLSAMNPFISFCLYVAARVFVQYLKFRPKDQQMTSSLQFLLAAMQALKKRNPLTESFLAQLDVDLDGSGIDVGSHTPDRSGRVVREIPINTDSVACSSIFEIRESQSASQPMNTFHGNDASSHTPTNLSSASVSPGPPFHTAVQVNMSVPMNVQPPHSYHFASNADQPFNLPSRQKTPSQSGLMPDIGPSPHSDMDLSPAPSGDNSTSTPNLSQGGSVSHPSSHSAFTPPNHDEYSNPTILPKQPTTATSSTITTAFFNTTDIDFDNFNQNFFNTSYPANNIAGDPDFGLNPGTWDTNMSGAEAATGMTPLNGGEWDTLYESIPGWTGAGGPPHR